MNGIKRRKVLSILAATAAAGVSIRTAWAASLSASTRSRPNSMPELGSAIAAPDTNLTAVDPLLHSAAAWIDQLRQRGQTLLPYPVSRLQREFHIGYTRTCALADTLAARGEWTVGFGSDGVRYAHIHQNVRA